MPVPSRRPARGVRDARDVVPGLRRRQKPHSQPLEASGPQSVRRECAWWPGGARAGPAVTHHQQPLFRNARSSREGFRPAHGDGTRRERGKSDAPAQGRPSRRRCPSAVRWPWCLVCDWRYRVLARSSVATEIEQSRIRSPHVVLRLKIARRSVRLQFDKNEKSRENDASVTSSLVCTFSGVLCERRVHRRRRDCSDDAATRGGGRRRGPAPAARRVRVRGDRSTLGDDADDAAALPVPRAVDPTRRRLVALCAVARPRARGGGGDALAERGDGR